MKTNKNSKNIRAAHPSQNDEQAGTNAKREKTYAVMLYFTQHSWAKVTIKAKSLAEAQQKADEIQSDEVADWVPVGGEIVVDSVCAIGEEEHHE